jgi:hypothetical protein
VSTSHEFSWSPRAGLANSSGPAQLPRRAGGFLAERDHVVSLGSALL